MSGSRQLGIVLCAAILVATLVAPATALAAPAGRTDCRAVLDALDDKPKGKALKSLTTKKQAELTSCVQEVMGLEKTAAASAASAASSSAAAENPPVFAYPSLNCTNYLWWGQGGGRAFYGFTFWRGQSITGYGLNGAISGSYLILGPYIAPGANMADGILAVGVLTKPSTQIFVTLLPLLASEDVPPIYILRPDQFITRTLPWILAECVVPATP